MIHYESGGWNLFTKLVQMEGSVFPHAMGMAIPCAVITGVLTFLIRDLGYLEFLDDNVLNETDAWAGFSFGVAFLIVFRTSQSYSRFWDGCTSTHQMRAEWFDGCSSLMAFCRFSKADPGDIKAFQNKLVRFFSMLHAAALAEIEDSLGVAESIEDVASYQFELIDIEGLDVESVVAVRTSVAKVELIFQWIQQLIVDNIGNGVLSIPPPILSRSFNEISNGMVCFIDAMKISYIPFPFPYAQVCDFLLCLHWLLVPFVVSQWVTEAVWGALFAFVQVFILWALNFIAMELENPFGSDANDIDGTHMQNELNEHLLLLLRPSTHAIPELTPDAIDLSNDSCWNHDGELEVTGTSRCFLDRWAAMQSAEDAAIKPASRFSVAKPGSVRTTQSSSRNSISLQVLNPHCDHELPRAFSAVKEEPSGVSGMSSPDPMATPRIGSATASTPRSGGNEPLRAAAEAPPESDAATPASASGGTAPRAVSAQVEAERRASTAARDAAADANSSGGAGEAEAGGAADGAACASNAGAGADAGPASAPAGVPQLDLSSVPVAVHDTGDKNVRKDDESRMAMPDNGTNDKESYWLEGSLHSMI